MSTRSLNPEDLFRERATQMAAWGIPRPIIARVRGRIEDLESNASGGWVYEWGREAALVEKTQPLLAAALWGAARFPTAFSESRRAALQRQVACYLAASSRFSVHFERRTVEGVPTHLFSSHAESEAPIVLLSGGLDTFKMDLHRLALGLVRAGLSVAAMDMPGTGETPGPLTPEAHLTYLSVLDAVARGRRRAMLGISFGGHWAAKLALLGEVDAAVDVGGPVGAVRASDQFVRNMPNGMPESLAHALGRAELPDESELARLIDAFSLRSQGLLSPLRLQRPLLVVNGDRDPYVPLEETTVFRAYPSADVVLFRDAWHCAGDRFVRIAPFLISWLRTRLSPTRAAHLVHGLSRMMLPAVVS